LTKLNILIVDYTTHHPEVVDALCRTFADHAVRLVVTSSFQTKFFGDFAFDPASTMVMPKKLTIHKWLAQLAPVFAEQDVIIFSTALRDKLLLKTLKLSTRAKKVLFVHNTHYFTERFPIHSSSDKVIFDKPLTSLSAWREHSQQRFKHLKRVIRHTINGTRFKNMADNTDYFCFASEHLADYFSQLTSYKNVVVLPTYAASADERLPLPLYDSVLRIAIIGLVSPDRRDYLNVIHALAQTKFSASVELHILGRCLDKSYAQQIITIIEQITSPRFKVVFDPASEFIPIDELRRRLLPIHLLLSPIKLDFSFHFYHEQYGITKISGAEADCIRYNRPLLIPRVYRYSERITPFVVPYGDASNLVAQIVALETGEELSAVYKSCASFSVETSNQNMATAFLARFLPAGIEQE
jgi:hypothetical protein